MSVAKNMVSFKLGKLAVKQDKRTLRLTAILKPAALPPIPEEFDFDSLLGVHIKEDVLGNNSWGDCVMVDRANATWRFEYNEQKIQIPITTDDVLRQYWKEQGALVDNPFLAFFYRIFHAYPDEGLVMLDSLKSWRKEGWKLNGKTYTIYAFAALNPKSREDLKEAVFLLGGAHIGIQVTQTAMNQFSTGDMWNLTYDNESIGGHAVYVVAYNKTGPICITWGKRQQMTWAFYEKYCEEAYAVVDNRNSWQKDSPIDCEKLNEYLKAIA